MPGTSSRNVKAYIALACVSFFWGTTYIAIRYGVKSAPPIFYAGCRQAIAGLLLCLFFWIKGYRLPGKKDMKVIFTSGFLMILLGNGSVTWASQYVPGGLAALICALTPIYIIFFNRLQNIKKPVNYKATLGILLGFAGMVVIFSRSLEDFSNQQYLFGILAVMFANLSWALGTNYISKNKTDTDPLYGAALQMLIAGILLLLISVPVEHPGIHSISRDAYFSLAYLIVFGSVVAYASYVYALMHLPTTIVSVYAYINTVVAVLLGWLLLDEDLTPLLAAGAVITIFGVYLVNSAYKKTKD